MDDNVVEQILLNAWMYEMKLKESIYVTGYEFLSNLNMTQLIKGLDR